MSSCDKFKVTKILENNLIRGKITYDKSRLDIIVKLYGINFVTNKNQQIKRKLQFLI